MGSRFLTILTGSNLPKIRQAREPEPSIINEKTVADFTRVVEQTDILDRPAARWGMPPKFGGPPVTNIRNTSSPHWRGWLKPDHAVTVAERRSFPSVRCRSCGPPPSSACNSQSGERCAWPLRGSALRYLLSPRSPRAHLESSPRIA
jgi:hypothetical protein